MYLTQEQYRRIEKSNCEFRRELVEITLEAFDGVDSELFKDSAVTNLNARHAALQSASKARFSQMTKEEQAEAASNPDYEAEREARLKSEWDAAMGSYLTAKAWEEATRHALEAESSLSVDDVKLHIRLFLGAAVWRGEHEAFLLEGGERLLEKLSEPV